MTVDQLIRKLSEYNGEMEVVTITGRVYPDGCEETEVCGLSDVDTMGMYVELSFR